jgi:tetratricopeptide (TPR) repeat protein
MLSRIFIVLLASCTLTGCDLTNKVESQYDDSRNPLYKQAQQDLDNNNPDAAIADYENALAANPKLAEAHYELGIIYGDKKSDSVGAIFHFKRFLELAPSSNKADQVKALIDKQSQAFAASLPNSPAQSADDYAKLQSDNATLKKQVDDAARTIAQLQTQLAHDGKHHAASATAAVPPALMAPPPAEITPASAAPTATETPTPAPAASADTNATAATTPPRALPLDATNAAATPAAPTGESRTYKVVSGDSIWKIAHKMYPGDTKNGVEKIQEANKDAIAGKPLKIGQVLIIPQ